MFNHDGDLMRVQIVEKLSRALVKHVRIDAVGLDERNAPLPPLPLRLDALDLTRQVGDLLVKLLARVDAIFPRVGVDAEITDEQRRHDIEAERRKKRTNPRTNNHRAFVLPMRLKRSYRRILGKVAEKQHPAQNQQGKTRGSGWSPIVMVGSSRPSR